MAKPKLALIPSAQGSKFYSVLPSSGVGDFDFTRSGSATRINSQGLIETVANGVSRLNYPMIDGVVKGCPHHILEPERTNVIPYSEDFSQWTLYQIDAPIANQGISPNGNNEATKITTSTSKEKSVVYQPSTINGNITRSVFAKKGSADFMFFDVPSSTAGAWFNLSTGELGTINSGTATIEDYGNGWYRCSCTANWTDLSFSIGLSDADNSTAITGGKDILIWGAQTEALSYATSYIPTNGGTVTRSAETADGSGDASTFNDSEGVLMAEISALSDDTTSKTISLTNGGQSNGIELFYFAGNSIYINLWSGGFSQGFLNYEIDIQNFNKVSYSYKLNDTALWINGFKVDTATSASMPIGLSELAFENGLNANDWYGKTKQIQYYDSALNDNELETLTSWVSFQDMAEGQLYTIE
jgi:hypothetical protein